MGNLSSKCTSPSRNSDIGSSLHSDCHLNALQCSQYEYDEADDFNEQYDTLRRSQRRPSQQLLDTSERSPSSPDRISCPPSGSPVSDRSCSSCTSNPSSQDMATTRFGYNNSAPASRATSAKNSRSAAGDTTSAGSKKNAPIKSTRISLPVNDSSLSKSIASSRSSGLPRIHPAATFGDDRRKTMPIRVSHSATTASIPPRRAAASSSTTSTKPPFANRLRQLFHIRSSDTPAPSADDKTTQPTTPYTRRNPKLATSKTIEALHPVSSKPPNPHHHHHTNKATGDNKIGL